MSNITIPVNKIAPEISESLRAVLKSHGYVICSNRLETKFGVSVVTPLTAGDLVAVEDEIGRNAAQCLVGLDIMLDEDD